MSTSLPVKESLEIEACCGGQQKESEDAQLRPFGFTFQLMALGGDVGHATADGQLQGGIRICRTALVTRIGFAD
jgi:hypothetical protein